MAYAPLSPRSALAYINRNALWPGDILAEPDLEVWSRYGRNAVFVAKSSRYGIFLKQARDGLCDDKMIRKEAEFSQRLSGTGLAPALLHWDPAEGVICAEHIDTGSDKLTIWDKSVSIAPVLAKLHKLQPPEAIAPLPFLTEPRFWENRSRATSLFFSLCDDEPKLQHFCLAAAHMLTRSSFTHGDAKAQNALFRARSEVVLIDFELGGKGDPDWDLATLFVDSLGMFLLSAKTDAEFSTNQENASAMSSEIFRSYGAGRSVFDPIKMGHLLSLAALTFAFQMARNRTSIGKTGLVLFQMSKNGFRSPAQLWESFVAS